MAAPSLKQEKCESVSLLSSGWVWMERKVGELEGARHDSNLPLVQHMSLKCPQHVCV